MTKAWHEHDHALRAGVEDIVKAWPGTTWRPMFGHPCFLVNHKLFAMIDGQAVVLLHLPLRDAAELRREFGAAPFVTSEGPVGDWLRVPLDDRNRLWELAGYLRDAYEIARTRADT